MNREGLVLLSQQLFDIFFASHQGSWAFLPILALVAYFLYRSNKHKGGKIIHMILRLFYLIMIVTGAGMLFHFSFPLMYVIKGILAIILIGLTESTLAKAKRNAPTAFGWIAIVIVLLLVVFMGFGVIRF